MRKIIILVLLSLTLVAKTDTPLEQRARNYADEYYSSFQQLAQLSNPYNEIGKQLELKIGKLVGQELGSEGITDLSSEIRISNDIDPILGSNSVKSDVTITNYVGHFVEYAATKDFGLSYKVNSCKQLESPSIKGVESDDFVKVVVSKTFSYANKFVDVDETMTISLRKNNVILISINNSYGTAQSAGDLLAQALDYYSKHQFKEALAMFEKQIELFGAPDAYWYAAIMYYKNQGCRGMGYFKRYEKFIEYVKIVAKNENSVYRYRAKFILVREGIE